MLPKKWSTFALLIVICLYQGNLMAAPPKKPDVRTMQDWSIVVADTAIESERYAAEEFRMTLGVTWLGQTPDGMTDEDRAKYRQNARKVFELCKKLNITLAHEARNMENVESAIRKALEMEENETF